MSQESTQQVHGAALVASSAAPDPVPAALDRLERRLARIESVVSQIESARDHVPGALAALVDSVDARVSQWQQRGIDLEERLRGLASLTERLTAPETLSALEQALSLAAQGNSLAATLADTLDDKLGALREQGIDLDQRARDSLAVLERLTSPEALSAVRAVLHSGILSPALVELLGAVGRAFVETASVPPPRVGAFGALRALSDAKVQRAVGFALRLAAHVGASLADENKALPQGATR